jgi:hypothetical protein
VREYANSAFPKARLNFVAVEPAAFGGNRLASLSSIGDDLPVPNHHKLLLSTNPNASALREKVEASAASLEGTVDEFRFDQRKNLAFVTITTADDVTVTFAQVVKSLSELDPDGIYALGPLNIHIAEEQAS